jgi:tellurite resistance protein TerC
MTIYWLVFAVIVVVMITVDLVLASRRPSGRSIRAATLLTILWIALALAFAAWLAHGLGRELAGQFVAGYLVESALSVDNLFVFFLIFRAFSLTENERHRILFWGVIGAIVMRGVLIAAGVSLISRYTFVEYLLGAFLIYTALRLAFARHAVPSWILRLAESKSSRRLLIALIAVESADLLFAVDSIPAVLAISRDTFIVFTSNVFAVLGLRSLYFLVAGAITRLRFVDYGIALVVAFMGCKMLLAKWYPISTGASLAVIVGVLAITAAVSLAFPRPANATS